MNFEIKHEKFAGPLDVLLDLIERQKLSISEISLGTVTDEYLTYVRSLPKSDPEHLAEFLVIAAQLMLIKSRSLLSSLAIETEEAAGENDLEARLAEYQLYRERARDLQALEKEKHMIILPESYRGVESVFYPPPKLTLDMVMSAFESVVEALPKVEKLKEETIKKIISIEEKIKHIRSILQSAVERTFADIVHGTKEKIEIIVSFLALLELSKQKFLECDQDGLFADIRVRNASTPPEAVSHTT